MTTKYCKENSLELPIFLVQITNGNKIQELKAIKGILSQPYGDFFSAKKMSPCYMVH